MDGDGRLTGPMALLTGGASRLRRAMAAALAEDGARVAGIDTPMMEQWGIPSHLMMPPSVVAGNDGHPEPLDPSAFVPEMQCVPRLEPHFPR